MPSKENFGPNLILVVGKEARIWLQIAVWLIILAGGKDPSVKLLLDVLLK